MTKLLKTIPANFTKLNYKNTYSPIVKQGTRYNFAGLYAVTPAKLSERTLLRFKACVLIFFSFGAALCWKSVKMNFKGKKIEKVFVAEGTSKKTGSQVKIIIPPGAAPFSKKYEKHPGEETDKDFRARIYVETDKAIKNGYVNSQGKHVKITPKYKTEIVEQLPSLGKPVKKFDTTFQVIADDTYNVMLSLQNQGKKVVGINMANRFYKGGGYKEGCAAQEEALCRRSDLAEALPPQENYPFPEFGSIYNENVQVFRNDAYVFMDEPVPVNLVACAAYNFSNKKDIKRLGLTSVTPEDLKASDIYKKNTQAILRQLLRTMAQKDYTHLVLGAIGCGAFRNPPSLIAAFFEEILNEEEFQGRFESVTWAILDIFPNDKENIKEFTSLCERLSEIQTEDQIRALDLTHKANAEKLGSRLNDIFYHFTPKPFFLRDLLHLLPPEAVMNVLPFLRDEAWTELHENHIKAIDFSLMDNDNVNNILKVNYGTVQPLEIRRNEISKARWLDDLQVIALFNNKDVTFDFARLLTDDQVRRLDVSKLPQKAIDAFPLLFDDRPALLKEVLESSKAKKGKGT